MPSYFCRSFDSKIYQIVCVILIDVSIITVLADHCDDHLPFDQR